MCSRDNFHKSFTPYFLRADQEFVHGEDLKQDIRRIQSCLTNMTPEDHRHYEIHYGSYPPPMTESIICEIWERHMRPWQPNSGNQALVKTAEENQATLEYLHAKSLGFFSA